MIEIRVTRPELYSDPEIIGNADTSAREGHYFTGDNINDAVEKATIRFGSECVDVEVKHGPYVGRFKRVEIHGPDERFIKLPPQPQSVEQRLEYLRGEINAEQISMNEVAELQSLAEAGLIPEGDMQLLEWAGVPEEEATLSDGARRAKGRPDNYESLPASEQWAIDKSLGILDWDGK